MLSNPHREGDFILIRRTSVLLLLLLLTGCVHTVPLKDAAGHVIPGSIARMETAIIGGIPQSIWFRGQADLVFIGRELLREPYWALKAQHLMGVEPIWPTQYDYAVKRRAK